VLCDGATGVGVLGVGAVPVEPVVGPEVTGEPDVPGVAPEEF